LNGITDEALEMNWREKPRIGVMGPSDCTPRVWNMAREVGRAIAERGGILICGGGAGVMEAAALGASEGGALTVGILPGNRAAQANPHIDIPIVTGMGNGRNVINTLTSQVIIAIHGAHGTLSEIALALKCGIPVVGLETWTLSPPAGEAVSDVRVATGPREAVEMAFSLLHPNPGHTETRQE
jgi:uncharacterized protein (TIGR00725 family)